MRAPKTYEDEVNAYAAYQRAVENAAGGPVEGDRWGVSEGVRTGTDKVRRRTADVLAVEEYRLPDGRTVTRRVLAPGFQGDEITRMGQAGGSTFAAEQSRLDLATRLREALAEGSELARDRGGRSVPVESLLDELAEFTGMAGRQIDPGVAQRAADYALDLNLPMDRAMRLATVEASGIPSAVRQVFYEEGLGDLIERRNYIGPMTFGGIDNASGELDDSQVWVGTREGYQALGPEELAAARKLSGKGRKMGPGKGRNKLDAEVWAPTVVEGAPYVPMLVAPRSKAMRDGRLHAPTVTQPRYDRAVEPERTAAWQLATYGNKRADEGMEQLRALRVPGPERMELNERGNARRAVGYDPSAVQMGLFNPRAVLDPAELLRGVSDPAARERLEVLAGLVEDYATQETLKDKTATGSFDAVGVPNPDAALTDPGAPVAGLARELDPSVQRTKGVVYPTLGRLVQRIMERNQTPMNYYTLGALDEPTVMTAPGGPGTRFQGPVAPEVMVATDGSDYFVIQRQQDGTPVVGPKIFRLGDDPPVRNADGAFLAPFRVGTDLKMTQAGFDEFEAVVNGLMASQGLVPRRPTAEWRVPLATTQPVDWMPVGNSWVRDPATFAAQNLALRELFGDELMGQAPRFGGQFPGAVERRGVGGGMDPYRNPLVGTMDLMERLARAVSDEEVDAPAALGLGNPEYAETWNEVVRPKLEAVQRVQQERAASAPGMRASDGYGGRIDPGPTLAPQADRPGILPTNAVVNRAPLPEGIDMATLQRVLARPDLADRGTLATIQGWIDRNYQSPTRSTPEPGAAYPSAAPARTPVDLASALASNAASTEEPRLRAVPDYGALIAQAQAGRQQRLAEEAAGGGEERTRLALAKARILGLLR